MKLAVEINPQEDRELIRALANTTSDLPYGVWDKAHHDGNFAGVVSNRLYVNPSVRKPFTITLDDVTISRSTFQLLKQICNKYFDSLFETEERSFKCINNLDEAIKACNTIINFIKNDNESSN